VISDLGREVAETCALLGYYTASSVNLSPTFRYKLSAPSSGFKNFWTLRMGPTGCFETSAIN